MKDVNLTSAISFTDADGNPGSIDATPLVVQESTSQPLLAATIAADFASLALGQSGNVTVSVANSGSGDAKAVSATLSTDAGWSVSGPAEGTVDIAAGASANFTFIVTA